MNPEHNKCLICNSEHLKLMPDYPKTALVKCENCSFVFSKKIPSNKELSDHYEGYSRDDYLSPITITRYEELLDKMEAFRKTGKLLDVGCGIGYFLDQAKKRGWHVYGTEYTDTAVQICESKGIQMQQGPLNIAHYNKEEFDVVTSFEVLEHINNPIEEIENFKALLRPGGCLYLTTPNFNSLLRYRLKEEYNVIAYPEHLSYYTPKTLRKLMRTVGFKTQKIYATGVSITRLRTSTGQSEQELISESSDDEKVRQKMEGSKILTLVKNAVNFILTLFGIGDALKGWFIKPLK